MEQRKMYWANVCMVMVICWLASCEKEAVIPEETQQVDLEESDTLQMIKLGKKLENPYSVANMRKAYSSLIKKQEKNPMKYGGLILKDSSEISTTDYYVKFLVENDEQKSILLADSLNLSIVPLDVEIEQEGDYYVDENTEIQEAQWLYTSVVQDYQFPEGVTYEKMEDLFLIEESGPEEEEGDEEEDQTTTTTVAGKSGISKEFLYDLEDEALRLTGNYEEPEEPESLTQRRSKKRPQGHIKVYNTATGKHNPVVGVKVKTRRWFKWAKGWTNTQGYYRVNRGYRRDVHYTVVFKNTRGFKIWPSVISISSARYRAGKHSKYGHNITFNTNSVGWRWATVNNATVKYFNYCTQMGIGMPHNNLRIVANGKSGGGAAPMLRRTLSSITVAKAGQFLTAAKFGVPTSLLWIVARFVIPDIIIKANANQGTDGVFETTFHELAHASHYKKVGRGYWRKYIDKIIDNQLFHASTAPYGSGRGNNHELVALGEAWGYHMGYFLTIHEFGNNNGVLTLNAFENFDPIKKPNNIAKSQYRDRYGNTSNIGWTGWIPGGIMNDLMDTNVDMIRTGFNDNVSGYSIKDIYDALDSGVESPQEFRDRLLNEKNNKDSKDVRALFKAYYWD
ncbi:MAG: hypothetical protein ACTHOM_00510 [Allomuricauda sp.]